MCPAHVQPPVSPQLNMNGLPCQSNLTRAPAAVMLAMLWLARRDQV